MFILAYIFITGSEVKQTHIRHHFAKYQQKRVYAEIEQKQQFSTGQFPMNIDKTVMFYTPTER